MLYKGWDCRAALTTTTRPTELLRNRRCAIAASRCGLPDHPTGVKGAPGRVDRMISFKNISLNTMITLIILMRRDDRNTGSNAGQRI